jgi:hypothetical protein
MAIDDVLTKQRILELFEKLDSKMFDNKVETSMFVVGGAAIALTLSDRRTTTDIDAQYENPLIDSLIAEVALEEELPPSWLNHGVAAVMGYFKKDVSPKTIFSGRALQIQVASPEYVLAMKLAARRDKDIGDIILLSQKLGIKTRKELINAVKRFFNADLSAAAYQRQQIEEFLDLIIEDGRLSFDGDNKH